MNWLAASQDDDETVLAISNTTGPTEPLSVGISDLIAHRECPRRAAYGARRHTGEGTQDHEMMTPEAGSPATWYGSAIHDVIDFVADGFSDESAIEKAWDKWGRHLGPEHLVLLKEDIEQHHERDFENVRLVLAEGELRVPLTETADGRPIYFRCRIDRLYERLDVPGHFIHIDYKSSKWQKTQEDVDNDQQLWAYNWAISENYPEIELLDQWLDQMRGGMVLTHKGDEEREQIREWLAINARAYFEQRTELEDDGLPGPKFNQWCPWCPILESCKIVPHLTEWALSRIDALRPEDMKLEEGRVAEIIAAVTPIDEFMANYDEAGAAMKVLDRYQSSVKALVHELPEAESARLGFQLRGRSISSIPFAARNALYEKLGHDRFMEMVGITQEKLKSTFKDKSEREWALSLVDKRPGNRVIHRTGG